MGRRSFRCRACGLIAVAEAQALRERIEQERLARFTAHLRGEAASPERDAPGKGAELQRQQAVTGVGEACVAAVLAAAVGDSRIAGGQ